MRNKLLSLFLVIVTVGVFVFAQVVNAVPISVPSAPSAGYYLVSTSTGQYLASSTSMVNIGAVNASSTATSTFAGGVNIFAINQTGTASSTFSNGIILSGGCFKVSGNCLSSSSGTVTSITAGTGLTGGVITTSGTIALDYTSANIWTGLQTFSQTYQASSSIGKLTTGSLTATSTVTVPAGSIAVAALAASTIALTDSGSTLTIGGSPATLGGTLTATFNLAHANSWTAIQTFVQTYQASSSIGNLISGTAQATTSLSISTTTTSNLLQIGNSVGTGGVVVTSTGKLSIGTSTPTAALTLENNNLIVSKGKIACTYASTTVSSGLYTLNWNDGCNQLILLNGSMSLDINATSSNPYDGMHGLVKVCQDSVGSRALTLSSQNTANYIGITPATSTIPTGANRCLYLGVTYGIWQAKYDIASTTGSR